MTTVAAFSNWEISLFMLKTGNWRIGNRSIENVYDLDLTQSRESHPIASASNKSRRLYSVFSFVYAPLSGLQRFLARGVRHLRFF